MLLRLAVLSALAAFAFGLPQRQSQIFEDGPPLPAIDFVTRARQAPFRLREGMERFAANFYGRLADKDNGNVLLSPFSLHTALGMLFFGSKNTSQTHQELSQMLGMTRRDFILDYAYNYFNMLARYNNLRQTVSGARVEFANKIFLAKGFTASPSYLGLVRSYFLTDVATVDYGRAKEAVGEINGFVEEKTRGLIKDLLDEDSVDGDTIMYIINAIYFKAAWKYRFNEAATSPRRFHYGRDKSYLHEKTMFQKGTFNVAELPRLRARVLELLYVDEDFRMLVFLPDEVDGISELDRAASRGDLGLDTLDNYMEKGDYRVYLPRFQISQKAETADVVGKMGAASLFDPSRADLSDIAEGPLYVQQVLHEAKVEVSEEGTEAAAATAVGIGLRTHVPDNRENAFVVDRPFLFVVQDKKLGVPLFMGRIVRPDGGNVNEAGDNTQPSSSALIDERAGGPVSPDDGRDRLPASDLPPCPTGGEGAYQGVYAPSVAFPCRGRDTMVVEATEEEGRKIMEERLRESRYSK